jgi:hypothetical protein
MHFIQQTKQKKVRSEKMMDVIPQTKHHIYINY